MNTKNHIRLPLLLAIVSLVLAPAVPAADEETARMSGSITVGAQGGNGIGTSSKLQEYETVPEGVFVPAADLFWQNGSQLFFSLTTKKLGLDDQSAALTAGKKEGFQLNLSWDQNPNWLSNKARTPYTQTIAGDTAFYHVPDGMRLALQNVYIPWNAVTPANPTGLPPSSCKPSATVFCPPSNPAQAGFFAVDSWVTNSAPIELRYVRKTGKAGVAFPLGENWKFDLTYTRERRDGNKNTTFYGGPDYEVATPIAFRTHNVRATADFADGRWFASGALNYSKFVNDVRYAEIDNPERLELKNPAGGASVSNDAAAFRLWLPPDNQALSTDLSAGVKLPRRHKITAGVSIGNMSMDTPLKDITTNPNLTTTSSSGFTVTPPYASVAVKYDVFMGTAKLSGDPVKKLGYSVTFRRYELKDKTQDYVFNSTVRGDVTAAYTTLGLTREHEGFSTQTIKGEVHVSPIAGLRFGVGYGRDDREYDRREYMDVKDDVLTTTADYTHRWMTLHGGYTRLKRKPSEPNEEAVQPTWQGATQTDVTARDRNAFNGLLTLMPSSALAVSLSAMTQTNGFPESVTGLLDQKFNQFGVDVTYAYGERLTAYAGYSYEYYNTLMAAAYFPRGVTVPPDFNPKLDPNYWENATKDKIDTFRVGWKWTVKPEKAELTVDVDYAHPRSDSTYTFAPGGAGDANGVWPATPVTGFPTADLSVPATFTGFPRVSKDFLIAKVRLDYHLDKRLTASALWWKQKFDNVDWANDPASLIPYMGRVDPGANRWFFLGAAVPSYNADMFRVALTYKF
jgi:hypothetical protein